MAKAGSRRCKAKASVVFPVAVQPVSATVVDEVAPEVVCLQDSCDAGGRIALESQQVAAPSAVAESFAAESEKLCTRAHALACCGHPVGVPVKKNDSYHR